MIRFLYVVWLERDKSVLWQLRYHLLAGAALFIGVRELVSYLLS